MTNGTKTTVYLKLVYATAGAVRYQEVDEKGNPLKKDSDGALVATQYLRKEKLAKVLGLDRITEANAPQSVKLEISVN